MSRYVSRSALSFAALLLSAAALAQSLTTLPINDPAYGVKAFTATIPAGWKFQGTVVPGP